MNNKNKIIFYAVTTLIVFVGGGYYGYNKYFGGSDTNQDQPVLTVGDWWNTSNTSSDGAAPASDSSLNTGTSNGSFDSGSGQSSNDLKQVYADDVYDFSFNFPEGFSAAKIPEDGGDLMLVQGPADKTFQVFISPFDEPSSELTPERVKSDLPDIEVKNPQQAAIGKGQIPALVFLSENESLGDIREVWFIWPPDPLPHGNYLYQVSAYVNLDAFLGSILETWQFK